MLGSVVLRRPLVSILFRLPGGNKFGLNPDFPVREGKVCFRAGEISPPIFSVIDKLRNTKPLKTSQNDGATTHERRKQDLTRAVLWTGRIAGRRPR